jgi:hypothetical protein
MPGQGDDIPFAVLFPNQKIPSRSSVPHFLPDSQHQLWHQAVTKKCASSNRVLGMENITMHAYPTSKLLFHQGVRAVELPLQLTQQFAMLIVKLAHSRHTLFVVFWNAPARKEFLQPVKNRSSLLNPDALICLCSGEKRKGAIEKIAKAAVADYARCMPYKQDNTLDVLDALSASLLLALGEPTEYRIDCIKVFRAHG